MDGSTIPLPGVVLPGLVPGLVPGLAGSSRILVLKNCVDVEELRNDSDYEEIVTDMQVGGVCLVGGLERCMLVIGVLCLGG